jgi:cation diffusion facilitator family transporter
MSTHDATREKARVALSSVIAAVAITGLKLFVGIETNSLGILSEAAHSGLDMLAAILTFVAVIIAARPPDKEHPYGHGKVENISAFVETILLVATCVWIIKEAVERLVSGTAHVEASMWGFGVIALSVVVDFSRSRALNRAAKKYRSQALEADALHFSSDVWSSLVVLAGLGFVRLGQPLVDAVAAIVVAGLVLVVSYRMGRKTIAALMDRVPEGLEDELRVIMGGVEGVSAIRGIRLRPSGPKIFLDTTVAIPRTMLFQQAHTVMDNLEKSVRSRHPEIDVIVHGEPFERDDETIAERIRMIILERGLGAPHHLEVHQRGDRYHVEFDIEFLKGKDFVEAHDITTEIEREIAERVRGVEKVTIHMEEYHPETSEVGEETGRESGLRRRVSECIGKEKRVARFTDMDLLKIGDRYNLSVTCRFDRGKTLGEIHEIVSAVEKRLYESIKELRRVTIHAEPA